MIVECSNCHARYNVDESKIPDTGIKVKCHKCQSIIFIQKEKSVPEPIPPELAAAPTPPPEAPAQPPYQAPPVETAVPSQTVRDPGEVDLDSEQAGDTSMPQEAEAPAEPKMPMPEPPEPVEPETVSRPTEAPVPEEPFEESIPSETVASFESEPVAPPEPISTAPPEEELSEDDKKWQKRARRLAKALASDLVLYNQDKVEKGLRDGTLAQLLGSEIRRSWEYYCQQIPKHIVDGTDYFKDQLNKIVGKGKEIFK
ncbi:MAG: zinc-ribbon domain-containing protein [bacterium]